MKSQISDAELTTNNWTNLMVLIETMPLQTSPSPTMFEAMPPEFLPVIYSAHTADCLSALKTPLQPAIPEPAAAPALLAYFLQGLQYTLQQRLMAMSIPAPSVDQESRDIRGKEPDMFDGTNRDLYPVFVLQLALLFNNNPHRYLNDICKIRAAGSYLCWGALNWFDPHCDKSTGAVTWVS